MDMMHWLMRVNSGVMRASNSGSGVTSKISSISLRNSTSLEELVIGQNLE